MSKKHSALISRGVRVAPTFGMVKVRFRYCSAALVGIGFSLDQRNRDKLQSQLLCCITFEINTFTPLDMIRSSLVLVIRPCGGYCVVQPSLLI